MESVEAEGNSIDEAIDSALKILGTTRDRVEVEIVSNAARGLFGIGGRKARVRATVRKPIDPEPLPAPAKPALAARPAQGGLEAGRPTETGAVGGRLAEHARQVLQEIVDRIGVPATAATRAQDQQIL